MFLVSKFCATPRIDVVNSALALMKNFSKTKWPHPPVRDETSCPDYIPSTKILFEAEQCMETSCNGLHLAAVSNNVSSITETSTHLEMGGKCDSPRHVARRARGLGNHHVYRVVAEDAHQRRLDFSRAG